MQVDAILFGPEQPIALALRMPFGRVATAAETVLQDRDLDVAINIKLATVEIMERACTATFAVEHVPYNAQWKSPTTVTIRLTRPTLESAFAALTPNTIATAIAEQVKAVAALTKIGVVEASKVASGLVHKRVEAFQ